MIVSLEDSYIVTGHDIIKITMEFFIRNVINVAFRNMRIPDYSRIRLALHTL